ncbi:hypothetical protein EYB53_017025 [Candidatus Chloroploca sp. M-50]|uniref:Uncharacterized protein n=1 Tax=Candidatus Chloroploca mongolica TaxID=2528176 RepID=A0ABS4DD97_9CHLR|nr:hypothetical protein [Candidatus Chloroploca mongolica]MBP1467419.1 hypothetical protein [Candidatus Chloroploca mongolica]
MKVCPYPCPNIARDRNDITALRQHLLEGHQCLDTWLSLSRLVGDPRQRRDCLERAAVLAPEDQTIREEWLKAVLVVEPDNASAQALLREIETLRLLSDVKTNYFHEQPRARLLGDILLDMQAITPSELQEVLKMQSDGMAIITDRRLGQILLRQKLITPSKLARALIIQQQERSSLRIAPQVLGEYLVEQQLITPEQLEKALIEQIRLDQKGQRLSLGQILIRLRILPPKVIEKAVTDHQRAFWAKLDK